ncbi:MAG: DNA alkylation repair protein, partial [Verrucomicrobiae bacterium]|nr:DNA alkylation repair protein [Verrucomicrobiae bacterium]
IYARHGVEGPCFGVSYANLGKLTKRLKNERSAELISQLWEAENHDARILATKLVHADILSPELVDRWAGEVTSPVLAGELGVAIGRSGWDLATDTVERWLEADPATHPRVAISGWCLLAALSGEGNDLDEEWLADFLPRIESDIQEAPDQVRHAMNNALIAIGSRSVALRRKAEASAKRIGKVEVDHGETSCKTPDAIAYLAKVWDHRNRKGARRRC